MQMKMKVTMMPARKMMVCATSVQTTASTPPRKVIRMEMAPMARMHVVMSNCVTVARARDGR